MAIFENKIGTEWGSMRLITILVPDTFLRKMIVISTMITTTGAVTTMSQADALNAYSIDYDKLKWQIIKKHQTFEDAVRFHIRYVSGKGFIDTEKSD